MKHFNGYRIRFALVGFVAAVILSSGDIKGDFTFGPAENLGPPINSSSGEVSASITADGLELYFNSNRLGVVGVIWVSRRSTKDDEWGEPVELGPTVNTGGAGSASVTGDGLELYFVSNRTGGYGQSDIWVSKRQSKNSPWGLPENPLTSNNVILLFSNALLGKLSKYNPLSSVVPTGNTPSILPT